MRHGISKDGNWWLQKKIIKISQLVEEGNSLSAAFAFYPEIFDIFYVSLIKTGEASGKIADSLYYLSDHLEREHDIESQLKNSSYGRADEGWSDIFVVYKI